MCLAGKRLPVIVYRVIVFLVCLFVVSESTSQYSSWRSEPEPIRVGVVNRYVYVLV